VGGLINVIEVALMRGKKEKARNAPARRSTTAMFCDFACFHETKVIMPFDQINEDSGTRDICIAFPRIVVRLEDFNDKNSCYFFAKQNLLTLCRIFYLCDE